MFFSDEEEKASDQGGKKMAEETKEEKENKDRKGQPGSFGRAEQHKYNAYMTLTL